jgi:DNA-binding FadR family transcriptional regulator
LRHIFHVGLERTPADDERWIKWHQDVYEAIASGQPDAARRQMIKLLNEGQEVQKLHRDRSKRGAMPE